MGGSLPDKLPDQDPDVETGGQKGSAVSLSSVDKRFGVALDLLFLFILCCSDSLSLQSLDAMASPVEMESGGVMEGEKRTCVASMFGTSRGQRFDCLLSGKSLQVSGHECNS